MNHNCQSKTQNHELYYESNSDHIQGNSSYGDLFENSFYKPDYKLSCVNEYYTHRQIYPLCEEDFNDGNEKFNKLTSNLHNYPTSLMNNQSKSSCIQNLLLSNIHNSLDAINSNNYELSIYSDFHNYPVHSSQSFWSMVNPSLKTTSDDYHSSTISNDSNSSTNNSNHLSNEVLVNANYNFKNSNNDQMLYLNMDMSSDHTNLMSTNERRKEEIHDLTLFAQYFKQKRIKFGITQAEVGLALGNLNLTGFGSLSQSTICRFESLSLSHNNMLALKPILETWLEEMEKNLLKWINSQNNEKDPVTHFDNQSILSIAVNNNVNTNIIMNNNHNNNASKINMTTITSSSSSSTTFIMDKKRKRTSITDTEKQILESYFQYNCRPNSEQLNCLGNKLKLQKNVIRVWFCNQRQKMKRLSKKSLGNRKK